MRPLRQIDWVVYAKRPFAGPETVLTYLSRYTHRVAISNRRLVAFDERGVTLRYKDYRDGTTLWKSMTLAPEEFIRRFLQHVLPRGFHRIRHYGLFANAARHSCLTRARALLNVPSVENPTERSAQDGGTPGPFLCRHCGAPLIVLQILVPPHAPRAPPPRLAA